MPIEDHLNCLKNLMQLMCVDGVIHPEEKTFLQKAAAQLAVRVDDWNALLKEVLQDNDNVPYIIVDRQKATAALMAMIVMAKADNQVDDQEKGYVLQFAKSIGVSRSEWRSLLNHVEAESLFASFEKTPDRLIALTEDFEKLDAFRNIAKDYGADLETCDLNHYLQKEIIPQAVVCFHAAEEKGLTLSRCQLLLNKTAAVVCILTRFQGHQVKYLHEAGLKKCVIEPVYARDIADILKML